MGGALGAVRQVSPLRRLMTLPRPVRSETWRCSGKASRDGPSQPLRPVRFVPPARLGRVRTSVPPARVRSERACPPRRSCTRKPSRTTGPRRGSATVFRGAGAMFFLRGELAWWTAIADDPGVLLPSPRGGRVGGSPGPPHSGGTPARERTTRR
jgi:hypothetical protein